MTTPCLCISNISLTKHPTSAAKKRKNKQTRWHATNVKVHTASIHGTSVHSACSRTTRIYSYDDTTCSHSHAHIHMHTVPQHIALASDSIWCGPPRTLQKQQPFNNSLLHATLSHSFLLSFRKASWKHRAAPTPYRAFVAKSAVWHDYRTCIRSLPPGSLTLPHKGICQRKIARHWHRDQVELPEKCHFSHSLSVMFHALQFNTLW